MSPVGPRNKETPEVTYATAEDWFALKQELREANELIESWKMLARVKDANYQALVDAIMEKMEVLG